MTVRQTEKSVTGDQRKSVSDMVVIMWSDNSKSERLASGARTGRSDQDHNRFCCEARVLRMQPACVGGALLWDAVMTDSMTDSKGRQGERHVRKRDSGPQGGE